MTVTFLFIHISQENTVHISKTALFTFIFVFLFNCSSNKSGFFFLTILNFILALLAEVENLSLNDNLNSIILVNHNSVFSYLTLLYLFQATLIYSGRRLWTEFFTHTPALPAFVKKKAWCSPVHNWKFQVRSRKFQVSSRKFQVRTWNVFCFVLFFSSMSL